MNLDFESFFDSIRSWLSELGENPSFIITAVISFALTFVTDLRRLYDTFKDNRSDYKGNHKTERKFKRVSKKIKEKQTSENLELYIQ